MWRCENHVLVLPQGYFFRLVPDLFWRPDWKTLRHISYCIHLNFIWMCFFMSETSEKNPQFKFWCQNLSREYNFFKWVEVRSKQDFDANFSIEFRKRNFIADCLVNNFESQGLKCRDKLSVHFMMNNLNALSWLNLFLCYVIWST